MVSYHAVQIYKAATAVLPKDINHCINHSVNKGCARRTIRLPSGVLPNICGYFKAVITVHEKIFSSRA
jgi:hypothetical protein